MRLDMPCLETEQLLLRPVEESDACDMFAYYSDPRVMRYLTLQPHTDIEETLNSIHGYFLTWEKRGVPTPWVMVHKQADKVIGNLDIHTLDEDIGQIGYLLHADYWNQGLDAGGCTCTGTNRLCTCRAAAYRGLCGCGASGKRSGFKALRLYGGGNPSQVNDAE